MISNDKLILGIEAAVNGGSISIFDHSSGNEIAHWIGKSKISKSEDLLEAFSVLLKNHQIEKNSFDLVVSAAGTGSLTGLKIGAATAKGLAKSFDCRFREDILWDVLAKVFAEEPAESKIFYIPAGRAGILRRIWQSGDFKSESEIITVEQFQSQVRTDCTYFRDTTLFIHEGLSGITLKANPENYQYLNPNLAGYITKIASDNY